ncbi:hypothetical protein DL240_14965 [Lujinxingia litoralis]|uniref:D-alanyl-D-alanine carboxypeptidase-like core domain-containing protein n=1 Tax=Lujinxingia litoralis TaxID=2211119 RepID=A0A328C7C9_9DELT|nr:D-alanyl-D-alanine carboxypeptidase family protein [Lujinxingia litoralis]RAL20969.1 hypothetical protein DL240_14965 [Lujinxingia litoralis]
MKSATILNLRRGLTGATALLLCCLFSLSALAAESAPPAAELTRARQLAHATGLAVVATAQQETTRASLSPRAASLVSRSAEEAWSVDQLLTALDFQPPTTCLALHHADRRRERTARWREAVRLLSLTHPEALHRWVLGQERPPQAALQEASSQLRCLIAAMIAASAEPDHGFRLFPRIRDHFGGRVASEHDLARLTDQDPRWLTRAVSALLRSDYRDLGSQGFIWYRKMRFTGRTFNKVSTAAGERCGLAPGQTWKPESPRHQRCWFDELNGAEREQEIIQASAAPGLSRHHWGTEFDILGLNPRLFTEEGPLFEAWQWLDGQALDYGFFQPFGHHAELGGFAHMEERWHWSYYPVAQALWEHLLEHERTFEPVLHALWTHLERRWGTRQVHYFDHMRAHWRDYLFRVEVPALPAALP